MTAEFVLLCCWRAGFALYVQDGRLLGGPPDRVTSEIRYGVNLHKATLLAMPRIALCGRERFVIDVPGRRGAEVLGPPTLRDVLAHHGVEVPADATEEQVVGMVERLDEGTVR